MNDRGRYLKNMSYAASAGASGCGTVIIIVGSLLLGLWLDNLLGTRPALTLALILLSIPVSLVLMVYSVISATSRMTPPTVPKNRSAKSLMDDDAGDWK